MGVCHGMSGEIHPSRFQSESAEITYTLWCTFAKEVIMCTACLNINIDVSLSEVIDPIKWCG